MMAWLGAALVALVLGGLEWRRADRRRRGLRLGAVAGVVAALAALLAPPNLPGGTARGGVVILLTPGADGALRQQLADSLPGAPMVRWPDSVSDLGALRRRWPAARSLVVAGWGLREAWWEDLGDLALSHLPAPPPEGLVDLQWPRAVRLGEAVTVTGRLTQAPVARTIGLEGPDGVTDSVRLEPAAPPRFRFVVTPNAAGRARYVIRVDEVPAETLGISVEPPQPAAILVLEGTPSFETAFLRRWLARQGAQVAIRTRLSRDRDRIERINLPGFGLAPLTGALLARFDLVLVDGPTLAALSRAEVEALDQAIREFGLGLLVMPDSSAQEAPRFFPFQLVEAGELEERLVRPQWSGRSDGSTTPVPAAPAEIASAGEVTPVMRDPVGRILAATVRHGAGRIGTTLVQAPSRWVLEEEPAAFAGYWATLVAALARPRGEAWLLGSDGPVVPDLPVSLVLTTEDPAPLATVTGPSGETDTLGLAQDLADPARWWGRYWPRQPGWHAVTNRDGAPYHFDVGAAADSPREAAARLAATARRSALAGAAPERQDVPMPPRPLPAWVPFLVLVGCLGVLWGEGRLAGGR